MTKPLQTLETPGRMCARQLYHLATKYISEHTSLRGAFTSTKSMVKLCGKHITNKLACKRALNLSVKHFHPVLAGVFGNAIT